MDNEFVFLKHFSTIICNYVDSSLIPRLPRLQLSLHAVLSYSKLGCGSRERGQKDASLLSWRRGMWERGQKDALLLSWRCGMWERGQRDALLLSWRCGMWERGQKDAMA